jgi:hypothetical protein
VYVCKQQRASEREKELIQLEMKFLPFSAARFLRPVTELTRYETLVETVYSSLDDGIFGNAAEVCDGAATRFDFEEPRASGSAFLLLLGSEVGSGLLLGSGSLTLDGSGSLAGSGLLDGSGSLEDSGSGSAEALNGVRRVTLVIEQCQL